MKEYLILKDFSGSQTGIDTDSFVAGTTRRLTDTLVAALGGTDGGYVKEAGEASADIAAASPTLADAVKEAIADTEIQTRELAEGEMLEEGDLPEGAKAHPAEDRETKVVVPEETKPTAPTAKKSKK